MRTTLTPKSLIYTILCTFLLTTTSSAQAVDTLYFPTGMKESSPLFIEHSYPEKILINEDHQSEVRVTNTSQTVINDIKIDLSLPSTFALKQAPQEAVYNDGKISWTIPQLAGGQTATILYSGSYTEPGNINQTLYVVCNQLLQNSLNSGITAYTRKKISAIDLSLAAVTKAWPDTPFPVTIKVSNKGELPQQNVRTLIELSPGLDYANPLEMNSLNVPALEPGQTYTTKVTLTASKNGLYKISADAVSDDSRSVKKEHTIEIGNEGLFSSGTNTIQAIAGVETPLLFRVQNSSDVTAKFCKVSVKIPDGFVVTKVEPYTNTDFRALVWFPGNLEAGQHADFDVYGVAAQTGSYAFEIAAESVDGGKGALSMGLDSLGIASTEVDIYDLQDPIKLNEFTTVIIKLHNKGNAAEKNLSLNVITNPADALVSAEVSGQGQANKNDLQINPGNVSWIMSSGLAPNADVILKIQVKGNNPGIINVDATINLESVSTPIIRKETIQVLDY